ncbi:MAG: hypothetical protein IAG13_31900 [Deltaproteobacteria bacterium]|nr:hypothetical protein [Nannocystaceae bacterium]
MSSVAAAVSEALPVPASDGSDAPVDLHSLQLELDEVAREAAAARAAGIPLDRAVRSPDYPALSRFHGDLRDALFVEVGGDIEHWFTALREGEAGIGDRVGRFADGLTRTASGESFREGAEDNAELQQALAELLVFESVRLRLSVAAWSSEDFERTGGDDDDIDAIAWTEVAAILRDPELRGSGVRPLQVMFAASFVSLLRDANERIGELRRTTDEVHEQLGIRARLRGALRELRLPEAVLLENALSNLLGEQRVELVELQEQHPLALEGMTRQAMDQRVSRGRRALGSGPEGWPRRRSPALFDLLRDRPGQR